MTEGPVPSTLTTPHHPGHVPVEDWEIQRGQMFSSGYSDHRYKESPEFQAGLPTHHAIIQKLLDKFIGQPLL